MSNQDPTLTRDDRAGIRVLVLVGEFDLAVAADFRRELSAMLEEPSAEDAVVDLSRVTFFDSSCLGVLLEGAQQAEAATATLVLRSPSPTCRRVLEISGVLDVFTVREA